MTTTITIVITIITIAAIRTVIFEQVDLATDFHGRATPMSSKILCRGLEPYCPLFVEEAMHGQDGAESAEMWRELADATTIPLATGERLYARWQFQDLISTAAAVLSLAIYIRYCVHN